MRICLLGPTGSGKSTIARYIARAYNAEIVKIAQPLYEFQELFYTRLNQTILGQDGEFLQFFGSKVERESPGWLTKRFLEKVASSNSRIIVNDDCRPHGYSDLAAASFVFVRVETSEEVRSLRRRSDHTHIDDKHPVELGFDELDAHYKIDNNGEFSETVRQIDNLLLELVGNDGSWLTGHQIIIERERGHLTIEPFYHECINSNSYNYHLSPVLHRLTSPIIDCRKDDDFEAIEIPESGYLLEPSELYLGSTVERFGSNVFASLITGRSSIGRKFITNHITAGLVDQGFFGNLTLEIVVRRPTIIYPNMKYGQIFWFTTLGRPMLYNGKYAGQLGPTKSKLHEEGL